MMSRHDEELTIPQRRSGRHLELPASQVYEALPDGVDRLFHGDGLADLGGVQGDGGHDDSSLVVRYYTLRGPAGQPPGAPMRYGALLPSSPRGCLGGTAAAAQVMQRSQLPWDKGVVRSSAEACDFDRVC